MGVGVKHIRIRWDRMKYGVSLDAYEINLSDEELSRAPLFEGDEEFDWGYRDDVIGDLNFYRTHPVLKRSDNARFAVRFGAESNCGNQPAGRHALLA